MYFDVLGQKIKVKKVKNLREKFSLYGCYNSKDLTIQYDPDQTEEEKIDTLIHETIHAFCDVIGLHLDDHREEILCTNLSRVLMQNFDIQCK